MVDAGERDEKQEEKLREKQRVENVDAVKQIATNRVNEYQVHGYDRQDDGYGGPYHPDAFLNPQVEFALSGDPEEQAKYTRELQELDEAKAKSGNGVDKVDIVAGSAHTTVVEMAPYRAAAATPELEATHENVEEAAARKHLVVPRSDEGGTAKTTSGNKSEGKKTKSAGTKKRSASATKKAADRAEERKNENEPSRRTTADRTSGSENETTDETNTQARRSGTATKSTAAKKTVARKETESSRAQAKKSAAESGKS